MIHGRLTVLTRLIGLGLCWSTKSIHTLAHSSLHTVVRSTGKKMVTLTPMRNSKIKQQWCSFNSTLFQHNDCYMLACADFLYWLYCLNLWCNVSFFSFAVFFHCLSSPSSGRHILAGRCHHDTNTGIHTYLLFYFCFYFHSYVLGFMATLCGTWPAHVSGIFMWTGVGRRRALWARGGIGEKFQ